MSHLRAQRFGSRGSFTLFGLSLQDAEARGPRMRAARGTDVLRVCPMSTQSGAGALSVRARRGLPGWKEEWAE